MCVAPYVKKNENYQGPWTQRFYVFPCGKCEECQKKIQNDWFVRAKSQLRTSVAAFFVTLTYNDLYLPVADECLSVPVLCKKDLRDFFKRLRHYFTTIVDNKKCFVPIKYLACGEYGGESGRPHYHFILFIPQGYYNEIREDFIDLVREYVSKAWSVEVTAPDGSRCFDAKGLPLRQAFGDTKVDYSNDYRIRYVVKYMLKGQFCEGNEVVPSFRLVSQGLGLKGFDSNIPDLDHLHFVDDGGFCYGLPRYLREKVFSQNEHLRYLFRKREQEREISTVEYLRRIGSARAAKLRNKSNKKII